LQAAFRLSGTRGKP